MSEPLAENIPVDLFPDIVIIPAALFVIVAKSPAIPVESLPDILIVPLLVRFILPTVAPL